MATRSNPVDALRNTLTGGEPASYIGTVEGAANNRAIVRSRFGVVAVHVQHPISVNIGDTVRVAGGSIVGKLVPRGTLPEYFV